MALARMRAIASICESDRRSGYCLDDWMAIIEWETRFRRVLCPVQLTDFSGGLLAVGSTLAARNNADLFTVHVLDHRHSRPEAARRAGGRPSAQEATIRVRGLIRANSHIDPSDVTSAVRRGDPVEEIVDYADRIGAELIVAGRSLPARSQRWGTPATDGEDVLTAHIARGAGCAVLSVGTHVDEGPVASPLPHGGAFRNIVCAVDFSGASFHALWQAISLAVQTAGFLTLVHVVPEHAGDLTPEKRRRLMGRLENLVAGPVRSRCSVREIIAIGRPVDELLKVVRAHNADLLVLGVTDRASADDSFVMAALEHAEGAVLLVPSADRASSDTDGILASPPPAAGEFDPIGQLS